MPNITAHITPAQGQTKDDVLALVLGTQHPRAMINFQDAYQFADGLVRVRLGIDEEAGEAEVADCAARVENMTGVMGVDSVKVTR